MKFKILSMLLTLMVIAVMPLIYMGKFDPVSFIDAAFSNVDSEITSLKQKAPKNLSTVVSDEKVQVYKWRDENGVMQFSNTAPIDNIAEQLVLDPNSNLMQAVKVPVKVTAKEETVAAPSPYSVKGMEKVMDDAKGIENLLQKRHEEQQQMMNNL